MKYLLFNLLLIVFSSSVFANTIQLQLQEKIEQAQKHLTATEKKVANERQKVVTKLNKLELEVLALRDKAAVAQRLSDEKTLSLSTLEERLASWRKQDVYQKNLQHRFLQQHIEYTNNIDISVSSNHLAAVVQVAKKIQQKLDLNWHIEKIVLPSGEITHMPTLSIGPMTWYVNESTNQAGLASIHDNAQGLLHSDLILSGSASGAIVALRDQSTGYVVFDPTLSGAIVKEQNSESVLQHVMKGGLWTIPIIAFGVFALVIALIKTIQLIRLPKFVRFTPAALNNVLTSAESKSAINVRGMQKILLDITCNEKSIRKRDDQLFVELQDNKLWLDRWIGGIAVTAAISPLLGLLGTVSGMIETFKMMTLFGSGDPAVVSGGIAQALVTTELGLVVAIPALILNAVLSRRAKSYYNDLESFAILLSKADEGIDIHAKDTGLISEVGSADKAQKALESIPAKEAIA
jgi:biopolymer transport protein ExbB